MTVKIITDSVADLPTRVVLELGITVVPLNIGFGDETFRDGIDITADQLYTRLPNDKVMPVTSVPSPMAFAEAYERLAGEGAEIIVITISSKLSGTYGVALNAKELMKKQCRIEVVDSQWAVMAQGFIVMKAAKAAREGASFDEVMGVISKTIKRVDFLAAFDTLEYLRRGGRIGAAKALLGSVLKINPIITLKDGVVQPAGRERSRVKALDHLYKFVMSFSYIEELAIEDANCAEDADALAERLNTKFPRERIYRSRTSPVIGTHTGPGVIMVTVLGDR
jgi:DegV family protein with EDD domain